MLVLRRFPLIDTSDPDACWEWPGARARGGYGIVGGSRSRGVAPFRVTRVMLEAKLGRPILAGMGALHTCDNPPCFNGRHLYEGDQRRNLRDAAQRDRLNRGEKNPNAKLTEADVRAIRADPRGSRLLEREYDVSRQTIDKIKSGRLWAHVSATPTV